MENNYIGKGGSPDLVDVVDVGRDAHSEGSGFIFWHCILDEHFFTYFCCKNCIVCLKRPKKRKRGRGWPIKGLYR